MNNLKKICMLSFATEDIRSYAGPIFQNNKKYCEKHGYDWVEYWKIKDESRPAAWSKILYILDELPGHGWVFWIDSDAIIMDEHTKLEEFTDERFDFVIATDGASWNTGAFFIQNTDLAKKLLRQTYELEEFIDHASWEQGAFINACIKNSSRVKVVNPLKGEKGFNSVYVANVNGWWEHDMCINNIGAFNAIYDWHTFKEAEYKNGDFVLHLAGMDANGRLDALKKLRPDIF